MKFKVMIARFPGGASDHPDTTDWLVETVLKAKADPRIEQVLPWRIDDTPITMGRNRCIEVAKKAGVDILVMIDSDMKPDAYLSGNPQQQGHDHLARPFWDSSLDFLLQHVGPCMIAAPYCGRPPHENIFVFQWANKQSDHQNIDISVEQFTREQAALMRGVQEVAALPTGLIMIDMRAIQVLTPPYFYYEWEDKTESVKASTEDVTFTRDASLAGVKCYCNWDAWAGHWKLKCVGKPIPLSVSDVRESFRDAVLRNQPSNERILMVNEGVRPRLPPPKKGKKTKAQP